VLDRVIGQRRARVRFSGPVLGLASMAFVLVVGTITAGVLMSNSGAPVITQPEPTTQTAPVTTSTSTTTTVGEAVIEPTELGPAPWSVAPVQQSAVPQHLIADWAGAENHTWCSVLFPGDLNQLADGATSRSAYFGGGWAVAWDLPEGPGRSANDGYCADCGRSAFGVAGAGMTGTVDDLAIWPNQLAWEDGSRAGYGLEGLEEPGSGAPFLGYVIVDGQGCLYNVWSFLGENHLQQLLESLRFVEGMQADPVELVDRANLETRPGGPAPWDAAPLAASVVPNAFFEEYAQDLGTTTCPMMAFADLGPEGEEATARRANGASALLVAWDLPDGPGLYGSGDYCADCGRGAFGTSLWIQEEFRQQDWNPTLAFDDGSRAWIYPELSEELPADRIVHLDPETGDLAPEAFRGIVEITDHPDCLYQVWSSYGPDHVEYLTGQLRYVEES
jgi:hypothetical protein